MHKMIPQMETKPQLEQGDGGGFIIMVIAFVLLGLLFWRMS
jgi:hypothetical protein